MKKCGTAVGALHIQPKGKGKIERWFRTARAQLLGQLTPDDTVSLDALNRRLWAFIEGEYHHAPTAASTAQRHWNSGPG